MKGLRAGTMADLEAVADVVAAAFVTDPLMVWLLPDERTRLEATRRWWTPLVASYLAADRALVTADLTACLLWRDFDEQLAEAPGQPAMRDVVTELVGPERLDEVTTALRVFPTLRPADGYVYVHVVATAPRSQGAGHGTRLLDALIAADPSHPLICLESTNPRNHSFYRRNGFVESATAPLPASTVTATVFRHALA